ncbi:hypothetical protein F5B18DRAFT_603766 [Nemania serpens]|nr:hypothetical protein F5B18DRAFT_603766 [Nemania serpens]
MAPKDSPAKGCLYFAYGSNLSTAQMRNRCPLSTPIGLAHLAGWTWIINERGYANIVSNEHQGSVRDSQNIQSPRYQNPSATAMNSSEDETAVTNDEDPLKHQPPEVVPGTGVYGLVYRLHPDDERQLDICEGVGYAYEREMLEVAWVETPDPNLVQEKEEAQHGGEDSSRISGEKFRALVYVDFLRVTPSIPWEEYVDRMNVGIEEALGTWGLPISYVDDVMRPYIPAPCNGDEAERA